MKRRKFAVGLAALTGGASFSIGTGAFSASRVEREADISVVNDADALVGLVPNEEIAGVDLEGGQLAISLSDPGINVNSVYQFGRFTPDTSEDTLEPVVGESFNSVFYESEDGFDPETNFHSAFMLVNQSSHDFDVKMTVDIEDEMRPDEPKYLFQIHDKDGKVGEISPQGSGSQTSTDFPLKTGKAHGVSFAIGSKTSEVGDSFGGSISVEAGEATNLS